MVVKSIQGTREGEHGASGLVSGVLRAGTGGYDQQPGRDTKIKIVGNVSRVGKVDSRSLLL